MSIYILLKQAAVDNLVRMFCLSKIWDVLANKKLNTLEGHSARYNFERGILA